MSPFEAGTLLHVCFLHHTTLSLGGKMGECSLYETATQEVITMYNDEFNNNDMYRFTNREVPATTTRPHPGRRTRIPRR